MSGIGSLSAAVSAQVGQGRAELALNGVRNAATTDQQIANVLTEVILEGPAAQSAASQGRGGIVDISV